MSLSAADAPPRSLALPAWARAPVWELVPDSDRVLHRFTPAEALRCAKAALLLCDRVYFPDITHYCALIIANGWVDPQGVHNSLGRPNVERTSVDAAKAWMPKYGDYEADAEYVFSTMTGIPAAPNLSELIIEIERGVDAGVFDLNGNPARSLTIMGATDLEERLKDASHLSALSATAREGFVASLVLAQVPVFPEAEIDALLDVRTRIEPERTRLAGAIAGIAAELRGVEDYDFADAAQQLARRDIYPAVADIDSALQELRAGPTLLRLSASPEIVAAAGASALTLAAARYGHADVAALAQALAGAPVVAAGAKEALTRRHLLTAAAESRFALLHGKLVHRLTGL